ncbi:MAG: tryptophan--tRNA ligase, partial [Desulfotomaculales bacterium]
IRETEEECRAGRIGCVACKRALAGKIDAVLAPIRERRAKINRRYVEEVIAGGVEKARREAAGTMAMVHQALGF